jgi:hypothetical protein
MLRITVRDGRVGRDPELVTEDGGEVLNEFDSERPIEEGEQLTLPNGETVIVISVTHDIVPGVSWHQGVNWHQTVHIGNL